MVFGLSEAWEFYNAQQSTYPIKLIECVVNEKKRNFIVTAARKVFYPKQMCYLNRYAHTIWAIYQKRIFNYNNRMESVDYSLKKICGLIKNLINISKITFDG